VTDIHGTLPAQTAAGSTSTTVIGTWSVESRQTDTVTEVIITPPAGYSTVTPASNTNYATLNVRQLRAGTVVQTFATVPLNTTGGLTLVAETPVQATISVQPVFHDDDVIDVQMVQAGTGLALGAGLVVDVYVS
jgi:hypothetical protein